MIRYISKSFSDNGKIIVITYIIFGQSSSNSYRFLISAFSTTCQQPSSSGSLSRGRRSTSTPRGPCKRRGCCSASRRPVTCCDSSKATSTPQSARSKRPPATLRSRRKSAASPAIFFSLQTSLKVVDTS